MEEDIKILEQSLLELYGHDTVIVNKKSLENLLTKYKNLVEIEAEHQRINGELGAELEKKDRQLEERTNRLRNLEKECQKYFDTMMDTIGDNNEKNMMICEMVKIIFNHRNDFEWWEVGTDIDNIEQQIQYFENKVKESK